MGSDLLLVGARIVDGTGGPRRWGYVAVEGDTIAHVGEGRYPLSLRAEYTIDVDGCYLCPGFIDV
ncbi:MAG TPA: D-aminoacylase, partial [Firmicutes bacterium]|nr:D-aminoacylase [Bacillota bacterium]